MSLMNAVNSKLFNILRKTRGDSVIQRGKITKSNCSLIIIIMTYGTAK